MSTFAMLCLLSGVGGLDHGGTMSVCGVWPRRRTLSNRDRRVVAVSIPLRRRHGRSSASPGGIEKFNDLMVCGQTREPRMEQVPLRSWPLPPAVKQGSLYENQKGMKNRFFAMPEMAK